MLVNLGSTSAASTFAASPRPGVTGTLPVTRGGTGVTSLDALKTALGIGGSSGGNVATKIIVGKYSGNWEPSIDGDSKSQIITLSELTAILAVLVIQRNGATFYNRGSGADMHFGGIALANSTCYGSYGVVVSVSGNTFTVTSKRSTYGAVSANTKGSTYHYIAFGN